MKALRCLTLLLVIVTLASCGACRQEPPVTPVPPTVTASPVPSVTATLPIVPTVTATIAPTATATSTPTVAATSTATPFATDTPPATPEATGVTLRGVHRVVPGDTLWGIAGIYYANMPLVVGANPLTPNTCWPGIASQNAIVPPQFIGVGWLLQVPEKCGQ